MTTTWRELKDGSIVASTPDVRFRISAYGDGSWLLESGAKRLVALDRYVSRAHAVSTALAALSRTPSVANSSSTAESSLGRSILRPANAIAERLSA